MRLCALILFWCVYCFGDAHIFIYQHFNDLTNQRTDISSEKLREHFKFLAENGYEVVEMEKLMQKISDGEQVPNKWITIAINGDVKNFYDEAFAVFKEYQVPFMLFVDFKQLAKYGSSNELDTIKSFGMVGLNFNYKPHTSEKDEIGNKFKKYVEVFEHKIGYKPIYLLLPNDTQNRHLKATAKKHNFKAVLNQNLGAVGAKSDLFSLNSILLSEHSNLANMLKYSYLNATWIEPKSYPNDDYLRDIHVELDQQEGTASLYITGLGWQSIGVKNGKIIYSVNQRLMNENIRIILKLDEKINTYTLNKGCEC